MKKRFTILFGAFCALMILISMPGKAVGQTRKTTVLSLDCVTPAPTGTTSTALSSTSDVATFLNSAAGLSNAEYKITCSEKTGDVYKGKGSGGGDIPQQCLKVGKASGGGGFTFTIPDSYDNIDVVEITCYGWRTTSSISINNGTAQTFTTAQTETTKTFELASSTKTITVSVTTSAVCITEILLKKNDGTPTAVAPSFSPAAGFYTSAQNVSISTETAGATIYYTTNGTDPTTSSSVYSTALTISETTTVKAMAVKDGYNNSSIAAANYVISEHAGTQADPYSVADARAAIDANTGIINVYARGIVCTGGSSLSSGAMNYWISDDGTQNNKLEAYKGKGINGASFTSTNDVQVGDVVVIYGTLTKYNSTYEFASGNQLVSLVREYTVTYDGNGATSGDVPAVPTAYSSGATVTVLGNTGNLTKTYCSFSGWNTKANGSGTPYVADNTFNIRENTTLYAQWTGESRTITYKAGAGSGSDVEAPTHYGDSYTIASNTFTAPTGKPTFTGWNTEIDGSGESYSPGQIITVSDDLILFAQWANLVTVTYTITSTTSVTVSGTVPTGSGITYSQTHNTACQMTSGNSMTLTLTGYTGQVIKSITLSMKSNTGSGAGNMLAKVGETNLASIATAAFNTASWNGAWSTSYVDITPTMSNSTHLIQSGENVVIQIAATANSLYCQSFTIIYDLSTQPVINADDVEIDADATSGEIAYTISNPDGNTLAAAEKAPGYNWIDNVTVVGAQNKVTFTTTANAGASREGYITLTYGSVTKDVKVTQAAPPVDYAFLPFNWAGGTSAALDAESGVSVNCGSDYAAQNAPYRVRFETTGHYILIKTNEQPAVISIGIKKFGNANTSSFNIQGSSDGENFTTVQSFNISGEQNDIITYSSTNAFDEDDRYVRIYFNKPSGGSNVGVGPISIYQNKPAPSVNANNEIESDVTIGDGESLIISSLIKIPNNKKITVSNTGVLVNTNPANLIIEDGGQLIVHNSGVQATIKKTVAVPSKTATNWYTIASPVRNVNIGAVGDAGSVNNLKAANGEYDLYRFNETKNDVGTNLRWENYKNNAYHDGGADDFTSLETGRGYLYRREGTATLEYVGEVNGNASETYTLTVAGDAPLTGFHLIGNPYSHDIYKGKGAAIDDTKLNEGFYRLTNGTAWTPALGYGDPIHSGEGILVQANDSGILTISNSTISASGESKYNNDNIMFSVANSQHEDVTYAVFDKGHGLNKIEHRDDNIPMLYISQNGEDYAIAMMSDDTKSFNLNFEAKTMGQYKLSYKVNGEFNYLHVIDRTTGEDIDMLLEGSYSFIGSPMDNANRFIVRLGYLPNYDDNGKDIFAYQNGNDIVVSGEGELQIFDVMGRKVSTMNIYGIETVNGLAQGVYIFRLEGKTQKIVVR